MKTKMLKYLNRINLNAGKKLLIVLFSLGLALGASAQRGHGGGGYHGGGYHGGGVAFYPRTYVGFGLGFGYPFYPYGGFYGPYGYPPYYYGYGAMPSRLALQIDDIKNDYAAQIKATKDDKSITRKERRDSVNQLKHDRDATIIQARRDYYYNSRRNNNNQPQPYNGNGQQQQPSNGNNQQPSNGNGQKQPVNSNGTGGSDQPEYESSPATETGTLQK